jgi:hypothetical protein
MRRRMIFFAPLAVAGFTLFIALGGWVVQLLWNWLLPPIFGWHEVTFWQALGLLALCRILFGGFRLGSSHQSHFRRRMEERWEHMSPEDRERFKVGIHARWHCGPQAGESKAE